MFLLINIIDGVINCWTTNSKFCCRVGRVEEGYTSLVPSSKEILIDPCVYGGCAFNDLYEVFEKFFRVWNVR